MLKESNISLRFDLETTSATSKVISASFACIVGKDIFTRLSALFVCLVVCLFALFVCLLVCLFV